MNKLPYRECENCKDWNGNGMHCMEICTKPYDAFEEFAKYMAIGTVSECRNAVSKTKAMKVKPFCKFAESIKFWACPKCGEILPNYRRKYCDECGQAISWEDDDE